MNIIPTPETPLLDEERIFFDIAPDGDNRNRIYVNFYQAGTFSVEVKREELEHLQKQLNTFLDPVEQSGKCCIGLTYEQCQEISEREKMEAREEVLDAFSHALQKKTFFNGTTWCVSNSDIDEVFESLRGHEGVQR